MLRCIEPILARGGKRVSLQKIYFPAQNDTDFRFIAIAKIIQKDGTVELIEHSCFILLEKEILLQRKIWWIDAKILVSIIDQISDDHRFVSFDKFLKKSLDRLRSKNDRAGFL